jgi:hypothetical protein
MDKLYHVFRKKGRGKRMTFRKVETSFWDDPMIQEEMTPSEKFFKLYLMTNPMTTSIGIYTLTKRRMAFDLGYSTETINTLMDRFENQYKLIKYSNDTKEIILLDWARENLKNSGKPTLDCVTKELKEVKDQSFIVLMAEKIESKVIRALFEKYIPESEVDEVVEFAENEDLSESVNSNLYDTGTQGLRTVDAPSTAGGEDREGERERDRDRERDRELNNNIATTPPTTKSTGKGNVKNKISCDAIYEHYLSKDLVKHKKFNKTLRDSMKNFIKKNPELTELEIKTGIDHYAEMYHSDYEFCEYLWGISELFSRTEGLLKFLDDGTKWLNYLNNKTKLPDKRTKDGTPKTAFHNFEGSYENMSNNELEEIFRDN